ncbi:putative DEAD-box ATP-dependent RNA helicase 48 [Acorus gramineus]|uniref:DEAD-box ATP-dependent RNA helicase 48 n=1 Tax=Acorus gramineus TaxID=55184 RepID=A0AAV9AG23_ACOGR|nr:putative DEAD-box ATP-dependent RNA helicase 48 [Acorus gramineus]
MATASTLLSFSSSTIPNPLRLPILTLRSTPPSDLTVRMGGGPRTFPGGVTKWQWKRMQAKKAKQLLKARLARERQMYEMRKRAELKAAVLELERPWETVERSPNNNNLFAVRADEQLRALADRFQRPGGFDLWTERDGPRVFRPGDDGDPVSSARFFPEGAVHSVKPYAPVLASDYEVDGGRRRRRRRRDRGTDSEERGLGAVEEAMEE